MLVSFYFYIIIIVIIIITKSFQGESGCWRKSLKEYPENTRDLK